MDTEAFTHGKPLHTERFYTQTLIYTGSFTHKNSFTRFHKNIYTQIHLHTHGFYSQEQAAFTHRNFRGAFGKNPPSRTNKPVEARGAVGILDFMSPWHGIVRGVPPVHNDGSAIVGIYHFRMTSIYRHIAQGRKVIKCQTLAAI